jgi:hypothetical protein
LLSRWSHQSQRASNLRRSLGESFVDGRGNIQHFAKTANIEDPPAFVAGRDDDGKAPAAPITQRDENVEGRRIDIRATFEIDDDVVCISARCRA